MNSHAHGGDLDELQRTRNIDKEALLDFSSNINPLGFPDSVKKLLQNHLDIVTKYPDKSYIALKESIANYTGADRGHIVVGNGATELISTFIGLIEKKSAVIVAPSYSEYERELSLRACAYTYFPLLPEENFLLDVQKLCSVITEEVGLLVLCNPNNPTGSVISQSELKRILDHCQSTKTALMIDETYIEFADEMARLTAIPLTKEYDNLFVIRGTSKFFACPGLRLGYGISSNEAFLTHWETHQNPWSVNSIAEFVGVHLFSESEFQNKTKQLIATERKKIIDTISKWRNCEIYPSHGNFVLIRLLSKKITSNMIYEVCLERQMVIRNAESFETLDDSYLRFCILEEQQNDELLAILHTLIDG
ncbi:MAG: aminotransferase class I/II-fold pyridoxal phosphate-dependent enzyme [Bacillota bacterium]